VFYLGFIVKDTKRILKRI